MGFLVPKEERFGTGDLLSESERLKNDPKRLNDSMWAGEDELKQGSSEIDFDILCSGVGLCFEPSG